MAVQVLEKLLDCSGLAVRLIARLVDPAVDFEASVVHHLVVVAAAEDFEDPLEDLRCCSFAVDQTWEALVRLVATHEAAKSMRMSLMNHPMRNVSGTHRQKLRHVLC